MAAAMRSSEAKPLISRGKAAALDHTVSDFRYFENGINATFHTVKVAMRFKVAYILSQAVKRH
jgi:hypothetical protein